MNSREHILNSIKTSISSTAQAHIELPDTDIEHIRYEDKDKQFSNIMRSVGGAAKWLNKDESIEEFIKENYDVPGIVATNLSLEIDHIKTNDIEDPHTLKDVDLAVIKGEFAVAENAAVWIRGEENRHRAIYFIARKLLILVEKDRIVDSMHEAYKKIDFSGNTFGTFISGPSKTADIEQSLVIGAHGAMECTVLFI